MPRRQPEKPIEDVVRELGRYPMDAFVFVQGCIAVASEQVHGPMSQAQAAVSQWMARSEIDLDGLRRRSESGKLPPDIAEALQAAGGLENMNRHVTGQELCRAVRAVALKRWGLMARTVLARWGITRTEDIGVIVFALVDNDWLQKQPTDSPGDFENAFSFEEAFDQAYRIE